MDNTEKLKLNLPSSSDYVDVEKLNENFRKIDQMVSDKEVTLRVFADENTTVAVSHKSGIYSGTAAKHIEAQTDGTNITRTYAEILLPCGGKTTILYTSGGHSFNISSFLMDGMTEYITAQHMTVYHSILAKVPDDYFLSKNSILIADENGVGGYLEKVSFETLLGGYTADLDHKNELWHAVRCGMITAAQYQTITGKTYPATPPTRTDPPYADADILEFGW